MSQTYQVKVLTKAAWDDLLKDPPCPHVESDSWGCADPHNRIAYVRDTKSRELNKYLIDHEFEHLLEEEGTDECACGIRHKKQASFLQKLFAVPTLGLSLPSVRESIGNFLGPAKVAAPSGVREFLPGGGGVKQLGVNAAMALPLLATAGAAGGGAASGALRGGLEAGRGSLAFSSAPSDVAGKLGGGIKLSGLMGTGGGGGFTAPGTVAQATLRGGGGTLGVPPLAGSLAGRGVTGTVGGGFAGQPLAPPSGAFGSFLNKLTANIAQHQSPVTSLQQLQGGTAGGGAGTAPQSPASGGATDQAAKALGFSKEGLLTTGLGAFTSFLGDKLAPKPEVPDFGSLPDVESLRNAARSGANTDVGRLAQAKLTERLQAPLSGLDPQIEGGIRQAFNRRRAEVSSQFKAFRPGADLATDSAFRQAMEEVDRAESETLAQQQQQAMEFSRNERTRDIATALGIDEQTLSTYTQLAQLNVAQIGMQLGVDAQTAQNFKDTFSHIGSLLMHKGLGFTQFNPTKQDTTSQTQTAQAGA